MMKWVEFHLQKSPDLSGNNFDLKVPLAGKSYQGEGSDSLKAALETRRKTA